ncbi:murein L,D-transpeptidase catalytic domain family protein [Hymenobacter sp. BT770]|uniref:murein L,D-transpeptidase catalytic domain family protein n=1 Tax=Hymenobacter sp. BT770 TaxID=2886942 RepID=UPI001D126A1F|nr:murein L,D-transpeptidase catalytic domain family protein [Hymenobacter sp. BT770]MCC3154869.1 murein L,D-transpeptidase catalytic domain family protein [Hymenobacter sp. BT770]MDO3415607.1 murein L,D-transpeptidase catalytic domain family protein [Hymenobacter sp. BT770]
MKIMHQPSVVQRKRKSQRRARLARRVMPFLASLFLATPLAGPVSKSMAGTRNELHLPSKAFSAAAVYDQKLRATYDALGAEQQGLRFETFEKAMTGYLNLRQAGRLADDKQLLTVVDFDLPSTEKRLWVFDLASNKTLFHTLVAHGHNSGENEATNFSNTDQSNMSSLGFYATSKEYEGKHGRSLRLEGLDEGFNTNAASRSVVMHGADYVSEEFIKQNGRLGRSLGCPALPLDQYAQIIDAVHGGTCLFINRSDASYNSKYLNEDAAITALVSTASTAANHS